MQDAESSKTGDAQEEPGAHTSRWRIYHWAWTQQVCESFLLSQSFPFFLVLSFPCFYMA